MRRKHSWSNPKVTEYMRDPGRCKANVAECMPAGKRRPKREIFSPTWYRTFSELYRSRFLSGVMGTFYLLSTFGKRESAFTRQRFIQGATFRLRIRLNGMFLGQNVFEDAASWIRIRLSGMFLRAPTSKDATLTSLIRFNGMYLCQPTFNPLH
jgi:hypothetical protein